MKYTQSPSRLYPRPRDIPMTLALLLVAPFGFQPQPIVPALQDTPDKKEIIEERTEIAFPIRRTIPADKETKGSQPTIVELAGMGVRDKYFINAKVYAFGWYVEPKAARKALTPWIGKTRAQGRQVGSGPGSAGPAHLLLHIPQLAAQDLHHGALG